MEEEELIEKGYSSEEACKKRIFKRAFCSGDPRVLNDPEYQRIEERLRKAPIWQWG